MPKLPFCARIAVPANYDLMSRQDRARVRNQYVTDQRGRCFHCGTPLDEVPLGDITCKAINWRLFPGGRDGFLRYPIHLHHNHNTGMTIGAVHALCNAVLWQYHGE